MKPVSDQFDLSGNASESVRVRLYLDEIKPSKDRNGEEWMYIGVLAIARKEARELAGKSVGIKEDMSDESN
jgi:hypothetical protein